MTQEPIAGELESAAVDSWPAALVREISGWRLRFHWGITQRSNSVWPGAFPETADLSEHLDRVEHFYRGWGGPSRFQISPASTPTELDSALEARGYAAIPGASVQAAEIPRVIASTSLPRERSHLSDDQVDSDWYRTYREAEGLVGREAELRLGLLRLIDRPAIFVRIIERGQPAAVGIGILRAGWVGVFCMATRPEFRRRGNGSAALQVIARWAETEAARGIYLQVVEANRPAINLYARCGFRHRYRYHYRCLP